MSEFSIDGFLSPTMDEWQVGFEKRYASKLELAVEVNRRGHELMFSMKVSPHGVTELLLSTLLSRQIETFQAFLLLARKGLIDQAEILVRALAETMFLVGATRKHAEFAESWIRSDDVSRLRSLNRLNSDRHRRGHPPHEDAIALVAELQKRVRDEGLRKRTTEEIAKLADLESYYDTVYGFFSNAVHSTVRSLDKALATDDGGQVVELQYGPVLEGFDMHFDYVISMTLFVIHEVATQFGEDVAKIEALQSRNRALSGDAQPTVEADGHAPG